MKTISIAIALIFTTTLSAQSVKRIRIEDLQKTIKTSKTPLIVNFWATFCLPCLEEIPYFRDEVARFNKHGVQLILVSIDGPKAFPTKIDSLAMAHQFKLPVMWLDERDADYFCPKVDTTWTGSVPASLFINNKQRYRHFTEDQLTREELVAEIRKMLGEKN